MIANTSSFLEKDAYNPVESYQKGDVGTIATRFTFNDGGFNGEQKSGTSLFSWAIRRTYYIKRLKNNFTKSQLT